VAAYSCAPAAAAAVVTEMELATADAAAEAVVLVVAAACNAIHDHMDLQAAKAGSELDLSVRPSIDHNIYVTTGISVHAAALQRTLIRLVPQKLPPQPRC